MPKRIVFSDGFKEAIKRAWQKRSGGRVKDFDKMIAKKYGVPESRVSKCRWENGLVLPHHRDSTDVREIPQISKEGKKEAVFSMDRDSIRNDPKHPLNGRAWQ